MTLHVGDTAPALSGTVNADLTGAAAVAHLRKPDGTTLSKTAVIGTTSPTSSDWSSAWTVGEVDQPGRWQVEVEVTYSGGLIQTFGPEWFYVVQQIA